jgi:hypothetical protein
VEDEPGEELVTEDMLRKAEREAAINEKKKRKLEEIALKKKENEVVGDPDDYENYCKSKDKKE